MISGFVKNKSGFTIVEVIIATIILVISLLGGVAFFSLNRNNLSYANRQRLATWAAIYKIEELKSMNYAALVSPSTTIEPPPPLTISGYSFTRTTTITNPVPGLDYKQATVYVSWNQGNFPPSPTTLSLTTYISEKL